MIEGASYSCQTAESLKRLSTCSRLPMDAAKSQISNGKEKATLVSPYSINGILGLGASTKDEGLKDSAEQQNEEGTLGRLAQIISEVHGLTRELMMYRQRGRNLNCGKLKLCCVVILRVGSVVFGHQSAQGKCVKNNIVLS